MQPSGKLMTFPKGEILIRENELSRKMFVLQKGRVRVSKSYMGQKITLAVLSEGEIFGEMSFFDAQPRSATVETLTPVEAFVVDADVAKEQLQVLPEWVRPVFRTVVARLRAADTRNTILQSRNDFEKRHFRRDPAAQTIYRELLRISKIMLLLTREPSNKGRGVEQEELLQGLDEMAGERSINLQTYWRMLKDFEFVASDALDDRGLVLLNLTDFEEWASYLSEEIKSERFVLLSHSALALLKRIAENAPASPPSQAPQKQTTTYTLKKSELELESMPFGGQAFKELLEFNFVSAPDDLHVKADLATVFRCYRYQSILKIFDHSIQY